eukprot:GFYU01003415.1.p1 GENE.GFYU01003415.1~~GFYU01003415.1.p1  ORF type:complete len:231 (-),score=40.35 GFYU01003415.1:164-856(-)
MVKSLSKDEVKAVVDKQRQRQSSLWNKVKSAFTATSGKAKTQAGQKSVLLNHNAIDGLKKVHEMAQQRVLRSAGAAQAHISAAQRSANAGLSSLPLRWAANIGAGATRSAGRYLLVVVGTGAFMYGLAHSIPTAFKDFLLESGIKDKTKDKIEATKERMQTTKATLATKAQTASERVSELTGDDVQLEKIPIGVLKARLEAVRKMEATTGVDMSGSKARLKEKIDKWESR